ncbi:MAG: hypothetical protein RR797_00630 [Christensenella sp.]
MKKAQQRPSLMCARHKDGRGRAQDCDFGAADLKQWGGILINAVKNAGVQGFI